jgi:hypothetical protein
MPKLPFPPVRYTVYKRLLGRYNDLYSMWQQEIAARINDVLLEGQKVLPGDLVNVLPMRPTVAVPLVELREGIVVADQRIVVVGELNLGASGFHRGSDGQATVLLDRVRRRDATGHWRRSLAWAGRPSMT